MIVKRKYERLVNTGSFENVKICVELEQEVKLSKGEEIKSFARKMGILAVMIVDEEAEKIKKEKLAIKNGTQEGE